MNLDKKYRIKRADPNNLAIQRITSGGNWVTISYHGNSIESLAYGLKKIIIANRTPEDINLCEQLEKIQLEMVSGQAELVKIIEKSALK